LAIIEIGLRKLCHSLWGKQNGATYKMAVEASEIQHQNSLGVFCSYHENCVTATNSLGFWPMLKRVWQELEYRIDVGRVTRGAHIEHL
jgi:hypothetical protein